jgi:hypothetical protein
LESTDDSVHEQCLYAILLKHLEAAERGRTVDRAELLAAHPEFAAELQEYLEACDRLEQFTVPFWRKVRPGWPWRKRGAP